MSRRPMALAALILCLGALATGCGGEEAPEEGTTELGASALRAELTAALDENAYLTAIAAKAVLDADGDVEAPDAAAAADALEAGSRDLAEMLGSVYGDELAEDLREPWREQGEAFLRYAVAAATGDRAGVQRAERELGKSTDEIAERLAEAGEELGARPVAEAFEPYVQEARGAIDLLVEDEDAAALAALREAAGEMRGFAAFLAEAIDEELPDQFAGAPDAAASELRAELTAALQEQAYLSAVAVTALREAGGDLQSASFQAASRALDESAIDLAEPIGSVYGEETGDELLEVWRERTELLVERALGRLTGDEDSVGRAEQALEASDRALAELLAEANPELSAESFAGALEPHSEGMAAAIDALAERDEEAFELLREAAGETRDLAATLADPIAAQFPDRFPTA